MRSFRRDYYYKNFSYKSSLFENSVRLIKRPDKRSHRSSIGRSYRGIATTQDKGFERIGGKGGRDKWHRWVTPRVAEGWCYRKVSMQSVLKLYVCVYVSSRFVPSGLPSVPPSLGRKGTVEQTVPRFSTATTCLRISPSLFLFLFLGSLLEIVCLRSDKRGGDKLFRAYSWKIILFLRIFLVLDTRAMLSYIFLRVSSDLLKNS